MVRIKLETRLFLSYLIEWLTFHLKCSHFTSEPEIIKSCHPPLYLVLVTGYILEKTTTQNVIAIPSKKHSPEKTSELNKVHRSVASQEKYLCHFFVRGSLITRNNFLAWKSIFQPLYYFYPGSGSVIKIKNALGRLSRISGVFSLRKQQKRSWKCKCH